MYETMIWEDGELAILDQTKLPDKICYITCYDYERVVEAIKKLEVRGAPAIGAAAAFAMVMGAKEVMGSDFLYKLSLIRDELIDARPTAVNLAWAVHKMYNVATTAEPGLDLLYIIQRMENLAIKIYNDDISINKKIGQIGAEIVPQNAVVITHCNAGAFATCGWGTALGVIRSADALGKIDMVYVDETRPLLQGARLTTLELIKDKIPITLITDGMVAWVTKIKNINFAITGADRIALNGDTANKIGTYSLALACKEQNIPFYIAAPSSTFDFTAQSGKDIPIELRNGEEIKRINDILIAPKDVKTFNPAFDVTPANLITGIITEYGILRPNYFDSIKELQLKIRENDK